MFSLYAKLAVAAAIVIALAGLFWKGVKVGEARVQLEWDADSARRIQATLDAEQASRKKEQELQDNADKQRKARDAQINTLNRSLASALDKLRNRPERPSGADVPATAASGSGPSSAGCTGAGLYKPDAGFLVGEAATANRLRLALAACITGYEAARAVK